MVSSAVQQENRKPHYQSINSKQQTSKFQQLHCWQLSHHTIMEDCQVNFCCDWLSTVENKWKRYLLGKWEFSWKLCGNLWKYKLPSCCQPTAIHLTQEAGSFPLAATCTTMMQGRRPSVQQSESKLVGISGFCLFGRHLYCHFRSKLCSHTREWRKASATFLWKLNRRHSKTNSFQEMTDNRALTMKTFTQDRT